MINNSPNSTPKVISQTNKLLLFPLTTLLGVEKDPTTTSIDHANKMDPIYEIDIIAASASFFSHTVTGTNNQTKR